MEVEDSKDLEFSAEDQQQLMKLKTLVEQALADGKVSKSEIEAIRTQLFADGKVTPAELKIIRETMQTMLGDAALEYEWS
ncbi:MAG: hypothetical protein AAGF24_04140 [Cyanobacteria bacterium P01_H01_bin.121]